MAIHDASMCIDIACYDLEGSSIDDVCICYSAGEAVERRGHDACMRGDERMLLLL